MANKKNNQAPVNPVHIKKYVSLMVERRKKRVKEFEELSKKAVIDFETKLKKQNEKNATLAEGPQSSDK